MVRRGDERWRDGGRTTASGMKETGHPRSAAHLGGVFELPEIAPPVRVRAGTHRIDSTRDVHGLHERRYVPRGAGSPPPRGLALPRSGRQYKYSPSGRSIGCSERLVRFDTCGAHALTSRGPPLAMESSDDDVPTGAGTGYGFARPNLATSGESSAHGDDDAGKVSGTIFEMSLLLRHAGVGSLTAADSRLPPQVKRRTMTAIELERANLAKVKASSKLVKRFGYHEQVERGRKPSSTSRTTTAPAKKENRGRDANAPALREGEWDSWDIAAPADGGGARPSSGDVPPWRTPARRLAECEAAATEAMENENWSAALSILTRCVPLAKAHAAAAEAVGGALTRVEATALSRAHFNIARVYERSRGVGLYAHSCTDSFADTMSRRAFRRDRDAQAAERDGLNEAVAHLRLAVASASVSSRSTGDDSSGRVARALAECKLRARAELGPKLLAVGDVADAAEVARRGLASCAESRVDEDEGKDEDEDAGAPRVGTRRDAATFLFLAGDCERALGEAAADAATRARRAKRECARGHDRERRAAMDAARRAAIAEAEDVAANARRVAARAALYERTSHTHTEGEKARREKTAALATAMAHSGAAAEMIATEGAAQLAAASRPGYLHNDYAAAAAFAARAEEELAAHERARTTAKAEARRRFVSAESLYARAERALSRDSGRTRGVDEGGREPSLLDADAVRLGDARRALRRAERDWPRAAEQCELLLALAEANGGVLPGRTNVTTRGSDGSDEDGDAVAALQSELAEICVAGKMFERARAWAQAAVATTEARAAFALSKLGDEKSGTKPRHSRASIRARLNLAAIVAKSGDVLGAVDAFRKIADDVTAYRVFPEVSLERAECYSALGGACFAASDRAVQDGDEKSAPGDGDDGYDGDEYDDASEELSRRRRRRARAASLALLAEADSSYELAAKIFRSIEGSVGSAAYEELVVRMDLVDDAIAEERRKGREDRERASL